MFEVFTHQARKIMQLANKEAQFDQKDIGSERILLAIIMEGSSVAANILKNHNIDLRKIRLEVEKIAQHGPGGEQFPPAKKIVESAIREARKLSHKSVDTEHLLLGLLCEQEGVVAQVLANLGLELEEVREEILSREASIRREGMQGD